MHSKLQSIQTVKYLKFTDNNQKRKKEEKKEKRNTTILPRI